MGCWRFHNELKIGDNVIFEDMLHYTTVKTNMFNRNNAGGGNGDGTAY